MVAQWDRNWYGCYSFGCTTFSRLYHGSLQQFTVMNLTGLHVQLGDISSFTWEGAHPHPGRKWPGASYTSSQDCHTSYAFVASCLGSFFFPQLVCLKLLLAYESQQQSLAHITLGLKRDSLGIHTRELVVACSTCGVTHYIIIPLG